MKIAYIDKRFAQATIDIIETANEIIAEYQEQGFDLTIRQIYYQMVARNLFPEDRRWRWDGARKKWVRDPNGTKNAQPNYKWLGEKINDGRLAGLIDWDAIVDRTRVVNENSHWTTPKSILHSAASSYLEDRWDEQIYRPEVWIEKDAIVGVISSVCKKYDVPYFSCRGYTSQSAMREAGHYRIKEHADNGHIPFIIHLGDHDPSGINMTDDIAKRLTMFSGDSHFELVRIALNMDQVLKYNPPSDPAKLTDSRAKAYIAKHGSESWELDALEPQVIVDLISDTLDDLIDPDAWAKTDKQIKEHQKTLTAIADGYEDIRASLNGDGDKE